jgi:protein-tyrosine-phosphatase
MTEMVKHVKLWQLSDPKGQGMEAVRTIRDDIQARVKSLVERDYGASAT